ncbi:MAPEG family protein [Polymorphobacter sp.]|uniref:MAPEG family protein n=1 Tax=Polymorphobacter sp. TaxID=1909290 RepID=UPI003F714F7C
MVATLVSAGLCGLIFFWLSMRVVRVRLSSKVSLGDGGDSVLLGRIRAHANFAEYVPFLLVLLLAIELSLKATPNTLWLAALALPVVRLAHAIGMDRPAPNNYRAAGALGTWVLIAVLSVWALVLAARFAG